MSSDQYELPSDQNSTGRQLGREEIDALIEVIESGTLTATKGRFVKEFQERFAAMLGSRHGFACASGTNAIHTAIAAIDPAPGDEIITSAITDMGAITPIIYQTAVPVFADVDPVTGNLTADAVRRAISPKTRAIVVTHLFGNPADLDGIMAVADAHGIPVIEDCAQAYGASIAGRPVGTASAIGCFSLQQGKHITTGEGGIVVTDDPDLARRMRLFIDKAWGYGDPNPDHYFAALNGRMTELQGAVALAQLGKLEASIAQRKAMADRLTARLHGHPGIVTPQAAPGAEHGYWKYPVIVSEEVGGPVGLARQLKEFGIFSAPRYIQKPAFECEVIRDRRTFGESGFPFNLARPEALDYSRDLFPGTYRFLRDVLVLPWNEKYSTADVDHIADRCLDVLSAASKIEAAE